MPPTEITSNMIHQFFRLSKNMVHSLMYTSNCNILRVTTVNITCEQLPMHYELQRLKQRRQDYTRDVTNLKQKSNNVVLHFLSAHTFWSQYVIKSHSHPHLKVFCSIEIMPTKVPMWYQQIWIALFSALLSPPTKAKVICSKNRVCLSKLTKLLQNKRQSVKI